LRAVLQRLLAVQATEFKSALDAAAQGMVEAMAADKADVFLYEPTDQLLVAVGTVDTPMARRQRELGLDRLAIASGGSVVTVFQTGQRRLTGHLDQDAEERRDMIDGLEVRSQIGVALLVDGERRGVLTVCSATPDFFSEADLHVAEAVSHAVSHWMGLVDAWAAYIERLASEVAEEGDRVAAEDLVRVLTPRQREIATLIAAGLTNAEIAQRLVIKEGTAANHVEHILRRLGFTSRAQVAVWAAERGLHRIDGTPPTSRNRPPRRGSRNPQCGSSERPERLRPVVSVPSSHRGSP